jgi:hypothetical protein
MRYERYISFGAVVVMGLWTVTDDRTGPAFGNLSLGLSTIKSVSGAELSGGLDACKNIGALDNPDCPQGTGGCTTKYNTCHNATTGQFNSKLCSDGADLCADGQGKCGSAKNQTVNSVTDCDEGELVPE